jgi:16S rRNA processing protein RimM
MNDDARLVILGRVGAAYGVRGWVKAHPFVDDAAHFRQIPVWHLAKAENGPWRQREVAECKAQDKSVLLRFADISDRSGAEALKGSLLAVPRHELPPTAANEFYWDDLIGMTLFNRADETLGQVAGCIVGSAHTILRVRDGETERLLPFVEAIVLEVDLAARRMRVDWEKDW